MNSLHHFVPRMETMNRSSRGDEAETSLNQSRLPIDKSLVTSAATIFKTGSDMNRPFEATIAFAQSVKQQALRCYVVAAVIALLLLPRLTSSLSAQSAYAFDIIARTSDKTPGGNTITNLGWGPSINDAGKVAFTVKIQDGREAVFVSDGNTSANVSQFAWDISLANGLSIDTRDFSVGEVVQIDNRDRVVWRTQSTDRRIGPDGLMSLILRMGTAGADGKVVAKSRYVRFDNAPIRMDSPFAAPIPADALDPWVAMNNGGEIVFSGSSAPFATETVISIRANLGSGGSDTANDFYFSTAVTGSVNFFPMFADNNTIIVRGGASRDSSLVLFKDHTLSDAYVLASKTDFTVIGEKPGISDDGQLVVFMGVHKTLGAGIFGVLTSVRPPFLLFKIAGDTGFSSLGTNTRIGVNHSSATGQDFTVVYLAARATGGPVATDPIGLFVSHVDVANPSSPKISEPLLALQVGNQIPGLAGLVQEIRLYDPVNNRGQSALWVKTSAGQAIVRGTLKSNPATNNLDIAASIELVPSIAPTLPGKEVPVTITLQNTGTTSAQGLLLVEVFLSSDDQLSSGDLKLDERKLSIQIPVGSKQSFQYLIQLAAGSAPGLDRAGLRHLIVRINGDSALPDSNPVNDKAASPCFWMGQVVNVITHGFNPIPDWLPLPNDVKLLADKLTNLPANSLLRNRVISYRPEWNSRTGFTEAFACLMAAKVFEAYANESDQLNKTRLFAAAEILKNLAAVRAQVSAGLAAGEAARIFTELRANYLIVPSLSQKFQFIHLIGHSRGAALNARLAQLLTADRYKITQFTSIDGFSTDWPDDAGRIGDISISGEAIGDLKINYRVQKDIANFLVDFVDLPNSPVQALIDMTLNVIKRFGGEPEKIVSLIPSPGVRMQLRKLDLRAPPRKDSDFKDVTIKGLRDSSNHLNVTSEYSESDSDSRTLAIEQYFLHDFEGKNRDVTVCTELTDFVFPPNWEDREISPQSFVRKAILPSSSRLTSAGILDGDFEDLGKWNDDLRSMGALPVGDPFIDAWLQILSNPATILGTLWIKNGQARLENAGTNHYVSLKTTTNTSIAQTIVLSPYAESLRFELAVSQPGVSNSFQVWQDNTLLTTVALGKSTTFQSVRANLSGQTGLGQLSFRLVGPLQSPAIVFLDNIEIVYSRPRIASVERTTGNQLKLSIEAKPGSVLSLEYSDDLKRWQEVMLWFAESPRGDYLIPPQTNSMQRFFRVTSY